MLAAKIWTGGVLITLGMSVSRLSLWKELNTHMLTRSLVAPFLYLYIIHSSSSIPTPLSSSECSTFHVCSSVSQQ